jgi:hypothetical protein
VNVLSGDEDPITVITKKARDLVFKAIEDRWQDSPFDPFWFAEYRHLVITPRDDIPDAKLIPKSSIGARTKSDPKQPKARVSFSLAREIGQTLLPDFGLTIRNKLLTLVIVFVATIR